VKWPKGAGGIASTRLSVLPMQADGRHSGLFLPVMRSSWDLAFATWCCRGSRHSTLWYPGLAPGSRLAPQEYGHPVPLPCRPVEAGEKRPWPILVWVTHRPTRDQRFFIAVLYCILWPGPSIILSVLSGTTPLSSWRRQRLLRRS
jgi:hypothetical protein